MLSLILQTRVEHVHWSQADSTIWHVLPAAFVRADVDHVPFFVVCVTPGILPNIHALRLALRRSHFIDLFLQAEALTTKVALRLVFKWSFCVYFIPKQILILLLARTNASRFRILHRLALQLPRNDVLRILFKNIVSANVDRLVILLCLSLLPILIVHDLTQLDIKDSPCIPHLQIIEITSIDLDEF